jgi:acyl-CoA dehydrogenase
MPTCSAPEEGQGFIAADDRAIAAGAACRSPIRAISHDRSARWMITIDYVKERHAFGKAILDFQNTQFKLAELKIQSHNCRGCSVNHCVGELLLKGELDARPRPRWPNTWVSDICNARWPMNASSCMAAMAYMNEYPVARMFRDARVQRIYGGTNEIMKLLISRTL